MKSETSLVNEVRVKLHILNNKDTQIRNLWMCLNYDKKPSVAHMVDHIRDNWGLNDKIAKNKPEELKVKLYLDDFWLPPYESSRLIRENDCIKVEFTYDNEKSCSQEETKCTNKKFNQTNCQSVLKQTEKPVEVSSYLPKSYLPHRNEQIRTIYDEEEYENTDNYYYHYYDNNDEEQIHTREEFQAGCSKKSSVNPFEYWPSNNETTQNQNSKKTSSTKLETKQQQSNSHKKFSIAGYAHMLNENVVEQPKPLQNKKTDKEQTNKSDFDKIVSSVSATGKQKWKNSSKPTQSNGPKHIIFPSTDSDSSSLSDSSDDEKIENKQPAKAQTQNNKKEPTKKTTTEQTKKTFYEPTKDEQLNTENKNRSFTVQNPKTLNEFKKVFDETKLNAPKAEGFTGKKKTQQQKTKEQGKKQQTVNGQLNTSTDSTTSSSSAASSSPNRSNGRKSPSSFKIDYDSLAKLESMPRLNDKLAFKVLEISSNFTPEISSYKTGTVIDSDSVSSEITIRLDKKYNAVLTKPNKFNVVLDETEEESLKSNDNDNILKIDWRNLMNLKLLVEEGKQETLKLNGQQVPKPINASN